MFYVYGHYTLDTNQLFYVGKGTKNRVLSKANRNKLWHNIVVKHDYKAVILFKNLTENEALHREKSLIKCLKKRGFCRANLTLGGGGISGFKHSESFKEDRRQARLGVKPWNTGKKLTNDHKSKVGSKGKLNPMFGKKHTAEALEKMNKKFYHTGESHWLHNNGQAITGSKNPNWKGYCVTPFGIFESIKDASFNLKINEGTIKYRCKTESFSGWYLCKETKCHLNCA